MKKFIALCLAMALSFALLAGCSSADPNNPYDPDSPPAPKVETAAE